MEEKVVERKELFIVSKVLFRIIRLSFYFYWEIYNKSDVSQVVVLVHESRSCQTGIV